MNEQQVHHLLELADAGASLPGEASSDLAERAIHRAGRRTAIRRTGLAVLAAPAAAAVVLGVMWMLDTPADRPGIAPTQMASTTQQPVSPPDFTPDHKRELADLRARVAAQEAVIELLLAKERRPGPRVLRASNPLDEIHTQVDIAAKQMVMTAAHIEQTRGPSELTERLYRDVVTYFPDSDWAEVARRQLDGPDLLTEPRSAL